MKISIIGCGYVGIVTGICLAEMGHTVTLVDIDAEKVAAISAGKTPVFEPGLEDMLKKNREKIYATTDSRKAIISTDITFICVGTPSSADGSINLDAIRGVSEEIGRALMQKKDFHIVVVKSTVLPGTTENIVIPLIETLSGKTSGSGFGIAVNPEFLREGMAVDDFLHPDRIIIGTSDERTEKTIDKIYSSHTCPKLVVSLKTAEMIKYASNAFLATKISFANEIGNVCKQLGIDAYDVFRGVGMDKRINPAFFNAGIGFGGSCFPKDLRALISKARQLGIQPEILESVVAVNDKQPEIVIALLKKHVPDLKDKQIGILGLAFKPGTDDIRDSRAIPLIRHLLDEGARIKAYDPEAMDNFRKVFPGIGFALSPEEVLGSDAVIIVTEWGIFENLDYHNNIVIDGRKVMKSRNTARIYEGVCW